MMGFAWGTGALVVPLVGLLADRIGLPRALMCVAVSPAVAAGIAAMLPVPAGRPAPAMPELINPATPEVPDAQPADHRSGQPGVGV
jgi:nitrate/nitrite transporter NarK